MTRAKDSIPDIPYQARRVSNMDIRQKNMVILEVQTYLRELYKAGYALPLITPDGIYGSLTEDAVRDFQRIEGLTESGAVDFNTWERLVFTAEKYREIYTPPEKISPYDTLLYSGELSLGDTSDLIYIIQIMLRALHVYDYSYIKVSGTFDEDTATALSDFGIRNNASTDRGKITKELWNALAIASSQYILKNAGD